MKSFLKAVNKTAALFVAVYFLFGACLSYGQTGVNVQKIDGTPLATHPPGVLPVFMVPPTNTPTVTATHTVTATPTPTGTWNTPTNTPTITPTLTATPTVWVSTGCFDAIAGNVVNLVSIRGSSSKRIRITNIRFGDGPSASTNGQVFKLLREATPSSGGTAGTPLNMVPGGPTPSWSYGYSTAGASVTPGTSSGTIRAQSQNRPTGAIQAIPVDFGPYGPNAFGFTLRNQFDSLLLTIDATAGVTIHGCVDVEEEI